LHAYLCSSLEGLGLEGSIPPGGYRLPETLEVLDLSNNAINGSLPEYWDNLPGNQTARLLDEEEFGDFIQNDDPEPTMGVFQLDLRDNNLSGEAPPCVTGLCGTSPHKGLVTTLPLWRAHARNEASQILSAPTRVHKL
jgi:hypothetical protein